MGARLFGLATFLVGLAIIFTDLLRPGGWPVLGAIVMLMGLADSFFAPKLMKRAWDNEDRSAVERPVDQRAQARPPDGRER
jgi:hypothetical protein